MANAMPTAPVTWNSERQPNAIISATSTAGASAGPHFDDESHTPVAKPRSLPGNHAAVIFAEVGQHGASPTASSTRITMRPEIEPTTPVSHVATLHQSMPTA